MKRYYLFLIKKYSFLYGEDSYERILRQQVIIKIIFSVVATALLCIKSIFFGFVLTDFFAMAVLMAVVVFLPDFLIVQKAEKKKEKLKYGLADFMDRTAILLDSGMPLWSALSFASVNSDDNDPFAFEMKNTVQSFSGKDGCYYRPEECLEQLAERCSTLMVSSFVSLIVQNSRKGSDELAFILKAQSGTFRTEQRNMAKKRAEEAATLLLFPTALVFIAILAMVATPALMTVFSGMSV